MQKTRKTGIARLLEIAGKRKITLFFSALLAVLYALLSIIPYISIAFILQELTQTAPDFSMIQTFIWYAVIAVGVWLLLLYASTILSHIAAFSILTQLRKNIIQRVGDMSMWGVTKQSSWVFKKILYDDVERIETFVAHYVPDIVKAVVLPVVTIIFLGTQDWRMALMTLVPLIVFIILMLLSYNKKNTILIEQYHQSHESMNSGIVEYVRAIPVMKIFGQSAESFEKYGAAVRNFHYFIMEYIKSHASGFALLMSFVNNAVFPILAFGLYLYFQHGVTLGVLLLFLLLGTGYMRHMFVLNNAGMQISMISRGVTQIDTLLDEPPLSQGTQSLTPPNFDIAFHHVSFSYNSREKVLKNITLQFPQGTITALVGPSGAGKSTIGQLLTRFYEVESGEITIGGISLDQYPSAQLMGMVSFVFQDNFMFSRSLRDNISMGMDVSEEDIVRAAKKAHIHEVIMSFPDGYDTLYGASWVHLSGGQEQRFAIARALLKDAPILVLDEATAFCDGENEYQIQKSLSELIENKTVIIIAHRLSTITHADQIVVLERGEVSAIGTHTELLSASPLYQNMWAAHTRAGDFAIEK